MPRRDQGRHEEIGATETTWEGAKLRASPAGEPGINRILATLGVWTRDGSDALDMLGLGKFRDTDEAASRPIA